MVPILFEKNATDYTNWGLCFLYDLVSCIVEEERNGEFTLTAVISCESPAYNELVTDRIIYARCYDSDHDVGGFYAAKEQPFRIYYISKPINGKVTVKAEHIARAAMRYGVLGPLDADVEGTSANWGAMTKYGSVNSVSFRFSGFSSPVFPKHSTPINAKDYMGGVEGSILDRNHCEYGYSNYTITAAKERGSDRGAQIRYGRDMTDFNAEEDTLATYTGCLAYYYNQSNGTYKRGSIVYSPNRSRYAQDRIYLLDCSSDYQTTPTVDQLTARAQSHVNTADFGVPKITYTIDLIPIWSAVDRGGITDLSVVDIRLCDTVDVIFDRLGITAKAKAIKTEYNVLKDRMEKITIGNAKSSLPKTMARVMKKTGVTPR